MMPQEVKNAHDSFGLLSEFWDPSHVYMDLLGAALVLKVVRTSDLGETAF
jgi:hypothetical protein